MNREYLKALRSLNPQQRRAVETINGPELVIAGPGTGKTELLALRVAEILRKDTTMLPSNILCLTFTNSASDNMLDRLIKYIGQDAYKVGIHTFNSFGAYVMNAHPEYFYEWRETKTADELTTHTILEGILNTLPGNHPLAAKSSDGLFYAQTQIRNFIGDAKRADLSPSELQLILDDNRKTYHKLKPIIRKYWPERVSSGALRDIDKLIIQLKKFEVPKSSIAATVPLQKIILDSLYMAANESQEVKLGKTKPFTAWKNQWLEKNEENKLVFKGEKQQERLEASVKIYQIYQNELNKRSLADFNDQIMWVISKMQKNPELSYNLQERFQYIMVDEFQDTNRSQLLMVQRLTDAPVHEDKPNILVVGDDDQAIYRFQGADIGNVGLFEQLYKNPLRITLKVNYRSNQEILDSSKRISRQINSSLEKQKNIIKKLDATVKKLGEGVKLYASEHETEHNDFVAETIKKKLSKGTLGSQIAVLARERVQLDNLVPYMHQKGIPISYERRENVLSQPHIINLLNMVRLIYWLDRQELVKANELFAQVLSEPMWQIEPIELWTVATKAHNSGRLWFDIIAKKKSGKCRQIADFFIRLGFASSTTPLEQILNELIGTQSIGAQDEHTDEIKPKKTDFFSPFKKYYFGEEILKENPSKYLTLLSHLATLRRHLHNFQTDSQRTLYAADLVELVDAYKHSGMVMLDQGPRNEDEDAVQMMTVHKAKGLEFTDVFAIGLQNDIWTRSTSRGRFSYPENLKPIRPSDNQDDDSLRLLFVAMTRAKQSLYLNYYKKNEEGDPSHLYAPLLAVDIKQEQPKIKKRPIALVNEYEQRWLARLENLKGRNLAAFFEQRLKNYRISVTHLNNFLDVSLGGPLYFFEQNLLHFPAAMNPMAIYGSVVHTALSRAHRRVLEGKRLDPELIIRDFIKDINGEALSEVDKQYYRDRGAKALKVYLTKMASNFNKEQLVDYDFSRQGIAIGDARLRGVVDLIELYKRDKKAVISDYKTGQVAYRWQLPPSANEHQRIRIHRYRNQLLFYKLLIDGARDFGQQGWKIEKGSLNFVEPDRGRIKTLELGYDQSEIDRFRKLVLAVWTKILNLDFPDVSQYPKTYEGTMQFEEDLIK